VDVEPHDAVGSARIGPEERRRLPTPGIFTGAALPLLVGGADDLAVAPPLLGVLHPDPALIISVMHPYRLDDHITVEGRAVGGDEGELGRENVLESGEPGAVGGTGEPRFEEGVQFPNLDDRVGLHLDSVAHALLMP
jgi:hypothetical protein